MKAPLVYYSRNYDMSMLGLEKLHPFDSQKPTHALERIRLALGAQLDDLLRAPQQPVEAELLQLVHSQDYLDSLRSSRVVAKVLEISALRLLPRALLDRGLLLPMRWAVQGTVEATKGALVQGAAINLAGGYHHAHRDRGEGFCVYADIPIAIEALRRDGTLPKSAHIAVVDLDAHRGNGFESIYENDSRIDFFDIYNFQAYPGRLKVQSERFRDVRSLRAYMDDEGYFNILKKYLPPFLAQREYTIVFYNAGTDVLQGDPLGRLSLTSEAVLERDRFVLEAVEHRGFPWVMVPSGGYTEESQRLLADTIVWACNRRVP